MQCYRKEKRSVTPEKAQKILAKHSTFISLEKAGIMLDFLYKLSKLSVSEALLRARAHEEAVLAKKKNVGIKKEK